MGHVRTNAADAEGRAAREKTRAALAARNAEHATEIFLLVGEREAVALAAGFVPQAVKKQAQCAVDWAFMRPRRRKRS